LGPDGDSAAEGAGPDALEGCFLNSYITLALRCAAVLAAVLVLLPPAGADVFKRRAKPMEVYPQVPPPAKTPDVGGPAPSDRLFDSRRLEGTGTLLLGDIMNLVRQSSRLADEVTSALRDVKKQASEIVCIGKRMDGGWQYLAGARVQPYICKIGDRWLELGADPVVRGARGETYVALSEVARKNARSVKESNPRWTWTSEKPRAWFLE
jgi:hypothetical protein